MAKASEQPKPTSDIGAMVQESLSILKEISGLQITVFEQLKNKTSFSAEEANEFISKYKKLNERIDAL